jgi:uncharacterized protein YkwD
MRTTRRLIVLVALSAMMLAAFAVPAVAGSAGQFISKINASRSANGLPPLEGYWDLADNARSHSNLMADRQELFHSSNLGSVTSGWERLGENVGVGPDVSSLHQGFMNSSSHRRNILGDYNYVGVGVTVDDAGYLWVTVIFMKAAPGLNGGGETTTTAPPTTTTTTTQPPHTPPEVTTTTTVPPSTTTTTASTTTTEPPASGNGHKNPGGDSGGNSASLSEEESKLRFAALVAENPRFGRPTPPAILD